MNKKTAHWIIVLQGVFCIVLFWLIVYFGKNEYEDYHKLQDEVIAAPRLVNHDQGLVKLTISEKSQAQSGISTQALDSSEHLASTSVIGNVISVDGLIDLRTRYLNAKAAANLANASLNKTQKEFLRMQTLNRDDKNVSDHAVLAAKSAFAMDQAKVHAAEIEANNLRDTMLQNWGVMLTDEACKENLTAFLQPLFNGHELLVLLASPANHFNPKVGTKLGIVPTGSQAQLIPASYVGPAPQANASIQGKTYFYRTPAGLLRAGMRVSGDAQHTPLSGKHLKDIAVPADAVVWYGGKAWVYKKQGKSDFLRVFVSAEDADSHAFYISNNDQLKKGDEVVTVGAQLLLSEEFKYQIKNDNDD